MKTFKTEFHPTAQQQDYIRKACGIRRWTWNWAVATYFEEAKKDNQNNGFRTCMSMWEYPYITWDGYYVPCCGKPFPKLLNFGNVFENDLMSVINSSKAQAFRKLWQKNVPHKFCHNCIET